MYSSGKLPSASRLSKLITLFFGQSLIKFPGTYTVSWLLLISCFDTVSVALFLDGVNK